MNCPGFDGAKPSRNDGQPLHRVCFQYDLINLDFLGGVGYRDSKGESKRVRAIKKLFERQQGTDFVLLLTLNVRDGIDDELTSYLEETHSRVDNSLQDMVAWYAGRGKGEKEYKLKAVVPLFIQRIAEHHMFRSWSYPPVVYDGTGRARMVHFVFEFSHTKGNFRAFSEQKPAELLRLPLICIEDRGFRVASKQHHGFDFGQCDSTLGFPAKDIKISVSTDAEALSRRGGHS